MSSRRYQANPVVSCREDEQIGALLYDPDADVPILLNPTGKWIWDFIVIPRELDEIAAHVASAYQGVTLELARQEASDFLQELQPGFVLVADA